MNVQVQERIEALRIDLGATGAILLDASGHLLVECGSHGDLEIDPCVELLGDAMAASSAVAHLMRDPAAFDLHIHEGQIYDLYTTRITDRVFLTLILERNAGTTSRPGMIWLTLRRSIAELRDLVSQAGLAQRSHSLASPKNPSDGLDPDPPNARPNGQSGLQAGMPAPSPLEDPPSPALNPKVLDDPDHVLNYEEARALGLINLDELEEDQDDGNGDGLEQIE